MSAQANFRARYTDEDALAEQLLKLFPTQRVQIKVSQPDWELSRKLTLGVREGALQMQHSTPLNSCELTLLSFRERWHRAMRNYDHLTNVFGGQAETREIELAVAKDHYPPDTGSA
ncbi:hypothetical protein F5Y10DRAFT_54332 [Nemania abortiva]|nr:hypothetical protein F5Y10DRAFT_54332 [Nemania abortiva]